MDKRINLCIDLKSFYASVECVERGLDPMSVNLVVADPERSDKTICLAITPAMKKLGISNRCRLFEIPKSVEYIIAEPRMKLYIDYAAEIYGIYLNYVAKEDIHVYSIDEAFLDVTDYLMLYNMTAKELAVAIMNDIFNKTGIRATCGIGTNLYLAKVALDITAKHSEDFIGILDEEAYRQTLWNHKPLTDFWRIGKGIEARLSKYGIYTMEAIAKADEDLLYRNFGVDAELLIDHAWGRETATIADIKKYKPKTNCISSGQVLMCDYSFEDARLVVKEMVDAICIELTEKNLVTKSVTLYVGYSYSLDLKPAKGTAYIDDATCSSIELIPLVDNLFRQIVDERYPVRRINISCNRVAERGSSQLNFFLDIQKKEKINNLQKAVVGIKKMFGKNSVFKAMDLEEKATTRERNRQIGGHKSGE